MGWTPRLVTAVFCERGGKPFAYDPSPFLTQQVDYLEAFAKLHIEVARTLRAHRDGSGTDAEVVFLTIDDGLRGVRFIELVQASARADAAWTALIESAR